MISGRAGTAVALGLHLGLAASAGAGAGAGDLPAAAPTGVAAGGVDVTPPTLTGRPVVGPGPAGWYAAPVAIRWTASDQGSGVLARPADVLVQGEGQALVAAATVFDRAGHHRTALADPVRIDLTPPLTRVETAPGWASTDRSLMLAAHDNLSGVGATRYRVDGGATMDGELVVLPGPGRYRLEYWSQDRAGNVEPARTVELTVSDDGPVFWHRIESAPERPGWFRDPVTISYRCLPTDRVARCPADHRVAGTPDAAPATPATPAAPAAPAAPVTAVAVDASGRSATDLATVAVDRTDPVIGVRADHVPDDSGWYGEPVVLTFSCWDDGSGIGPTGCPEPVTVTAGRGRQVSVAASDLAGNRAQLTVQGLDVDPDPPSTTAVARGRQVRLSAIDELSGVAGTYYQVDDGPPQRYRGPVEITGGGTGAGAGAGAGAGKHVISYWSVDRAGNVEGRRGRLWLTLP